MSEIYNCRPNKRVCEIYQREKLMEFERILNDARNHFTLEGKNREFLAVVRYQHFLFEDFERSLNNE